MMRSEPLEEEEDILHCALIATKGKSEKVAIWKTESAHWNQTTVAS